MAKFAALRGQLGLVGVGSRSPIQLVIDYTTTQFIIKFKLPSTKSVTIHWGDGTTEAVMGQDAVLIEKTSNYSVAGTKNFYITGDVYDLTKIDVNGQAFISGDYTYWYEFAGLTELDVSSTGMSGNIEGFAALTSMTVLNVDNTTATGNGALLAGLTSLTSFLFNSTSVTWGSAATMSLTSATVNVASSGMTTTTQVDNFIDSFKASTGSTFDVSGTNAHRTAASNINLNTLLANGNTITLNDVLGSEFHTDANAASDPNGNEADATTGFASVGLAGIGANKFESQGVTVATGSYAIEANANDTPTNGARFYKNINDLGLSNDDVVRISYKGRHVGSGSNWKSRLSPNTSLSAETTIKLYTSADITYVESVFYFVHSVDTFFFGIREEIANNGGVFFDDFSVRIVTFT